MRMASVEFRSAFNLSSCTKLPNEKLGVEYRTLIPHRQTPDVSNWTPMTNSIREKLREIRRNSDSQTWPSFVSTMVELRNIWTAEVFHFLNRRTWEASWLGTTETSRDIGPHLPSVSDTGKVLCLYRARHPHQAACSPCCCLPGDWSSRCLQAPDLT